MIVFKNFFSVAEVQGGMQAGIFRYNYYGEVVSAVMFEDWHAASEIQI
jgi:hypothetical protein